MKFSAGDIITVKTKTGATITGKVKQAMWGDYFIDLGQGRSLDQVFWVKVHYQREPSPEIIKVKRQLPTEPGSVIRSIETRSGQKYNIGVLYGPSNLWHLYTTLGHSKNITVENASNYIEHWEPDAT